MATTVGASTGFGALVRDTLLEHDALAAYSHGTLFDRAFGDDASEAARPAQTAEADTTPRDHIAAA